MLWMAEGVRTVDMDAPVAVIAYSGQMGLTGLS